MEQVVLEAALRDETGKGAARKMRAQGLVPGVVYGLGREPVSVSVSREELETALAHHGGGNVLFDLQVEGLQVEGSTGALVKLMQKHPVSRIPESVDFQWVSLSEVVTVSVQVVLEGEPSVLGEGAVIDQILHEVQVSCMPLEIPDKIIINIEGMQMHDTRTVADLQAPEGVEVLADPSDPVVTCTPSAKAVSDLGEEQVEGELEGLGDEDGAEG